MRLNIVPAGQGIQWVREGMATFRRKPIALLGLYLMFLMVVSLLGMLPMVGPVLALLVLPACTLGYMAATRKVRAGLYPMPTILFLAFRQADSRRSAMLQLGAIYALGFGMVVGMTWLIDGGEFIRLFIEGEKLNQQEMIQRIQSPGLLLSTFTAGVLTTLLSMFFWHAPALVYWHEVPALKSLFFSVVACLRNFKAFFLYAMAWLGIVMLTMLVVSLVMSAIGSMGLMLIAEQVVAVVMGAMFFASQYYSFRDCFLDDPAPSADTADTAEAP